MRRFIAPVILGLMVAAPAPLAGCIDADEVEEFLEDVADDVGDLDDDDDLEDAFDEFFDDLFDD
ncbi:MAG: hypothetical protein CHACPFDD_01836 [Phycisphaerae bacterium]|nr:hypothetical protein [Phycisphaerae bacterium]